MPLRPRARAPRGARCPRAPGRGSAGATATASGAGPTAWALLVYLGVVPTGLAYVLYVLGLETTPVTVAGILTLLEPLTATVLGVAFFGNRLGPLGGLGATLLLGAVALLMLTDRSQAPIRRAGRGAPCP